MNSDSPSGPSSARTSTRPRRLTTALTVAMVASWLLMISPLPYSLFSGLTGLMGLGLLIALIVRAIRDRRLQLAVFGVLLGIPALLMIIGSAALSAAFYGPMAERQECLSTAITQQARSECESAAESSMTDWVSGLLGG